MNVGKNEGRPAANGTASTRQDTGHELAHESTLGGLARVVPAPVDFVEFASLGSGRSGDLRGAVLGLSSGGSS